MTELPEPSAYAFGEGTAAEETRRVIRGRLSHAVFLLRGGGDPAHAVHETRKDTKKIRSALRLIRSGLDEETYRRENDRFREISRGLARFRDSEAMVECLDALEEWAGQPHRFSGLRAFLMEDVGAGRRDGSMRRAAARAADDLERAAGELDELGLPGDREEGERIVAEGLARAVRRGRRRLARVEQDPADEKLHDWRKRVKDLWYQETLVGRDPGRAKRAHELSGFLGDDHDLGILRELVDRHVDEFSWVGEHRRIVDLIARRRDQLQGEALRLGRPLYAEEAGPEAAPRTQASASAAFASGGNTG